LAVARDDTLWIGFADGAGIRRVVDGHPEPADAGIETTGAITDIVQTTDGTMWAVADGVLLERRASGWGAIRLPWPEREGRVTRAYVGPRGDLWIASRWGVFRRAPGQPFV